MLGVSDVLKANLHDDSGGDIVDTDEKLGPREHQVASRSTKKKGNLRLGK